MCVITDTVSQPLGTAARADVDIALSALWRFGREEF